MGSQEQEQEQKGAAQGHLQGTPCILQRAGVSCFGEDNWEKRRAEGRTEGRPSAVAVGPSGRRPPSPSAVAVGRAVGQGCWWRWRRKAGAGAAAGPVPSGVTAVTGLCTGLRGRGLPQLAAYCAPSSIEPLEERRRALTARCRPGNIGREEKDEGCNMRSPPTSGPSSLVVCDK